MQGLPSHLKKYGVEQNYDRYTPVDHAVWRFILRQLKSFLSTHAHECYVDGLEKTGIEIEYIPKISDIDEKLSKFGWRALPVSGFIPPAAFMELQANSVLPIAAEIRSLDHLLYTPAPDIVHEAAGHAPILINQEFANYLKHYSQVARKAIISREDLDLYEAIRVLSDVKENPASTPEDIQRAESQLNQVSKSMTHVSEAALLSRMNWWTAEYGLIGDLENPKIFGAGLLSSVGESRWCLKSEVKKIPLTVDCVKTSYDITEPQPQLFVTPDFKNLYKVLDDFASMMAFKQGGLAGVQKAIQAESVNTIELNTGLQISGQAIEALTTKSDQIAYLRFQGPCQLCYKDKELLGHDRRYHGQGFGTPLGKLKAAVDWKSLQGQKLKLEYESGVKVEGTLKGFLEKEGKVVLVTFQDALAEWKGRVLFEPSWGLYDIALGETVSSVFGGAADREAYGSAKDFVSARVPSPQYSDKDRLRHDLYQRVRNLRQNQTSGSQLESALQELLDQHRKNFPHDWLLFLEIFELAQAQDLKSLTPKALQELQRIAAASPEKREVIDDGLRLVKEESRKS